MVAPREVKPSKGQQMLKLVLGKLAAKGKHYAFGQLRDHMRKKQVASANRMVEQMTTLSRNFIAANNFYKLSAKLQFKAKACAFRRMLPAAPSNHLPS